MLKKQSGTAENGVTWRTDTETLDNGDQLAYLEVIQRGDQFAIFFKKEKGDKKFFYDETISISKYDPA